MRKLGKHSWIFVITIVIILACISLFFANTSQNTGMIERGKVLSIVRQIKTPTDEDPFPGQVLKVQITSGKYKGQELECYKTFSGNPRYDIAAKPGQHVILTIEEDDGVLESAMVNDVSRALPLYILTIAFVATLVLLGGAKGLKSLLTLIFTMLVFFKVLLPMILYGFNPVLATILLSVVISAVALILTLGWQRKTLAAFLGISSAVAVTGLLAYSFGKFAMLTGLGSAENMILNFTQEYDLSFQGVLFAAMIFGGLGALIDMAINIVERVDDHYNERPIATTKELFTTGIEVGRNHFGSISNVLILAYAGTTLPLMLILAGYQPSFFKIINLDAIATEVIRALIGGLSLFIVIPLTAAFAAWLVYEEVMLKYYP